MLTDRGNDMIRRADQPAEGRVQRLGRVGGKGDARRTLRAEQFGQRGAGIVDQPRRMKGRLVGTAAGVARCLQRFQHRFAYHRRFLQRGSRIVEVDHGLTTFPAFSIFSAMTYIFVTVPTCSFSVRP